MSQHPVVLALPDGRSYKFDLMALEGLRTEVGAPIREFAIPGMHWLECILKARRRLAKAFQQPNLLQPFEPKAFQQPNLAQPSEPCDDNFLEELYNIMQPTSLAKEDFLAACSHAKSQESGSNARAAWDTIDRDGRALVHLEKARSMCTHCNDSMSDKGKIRDVTFGMLLRLIKDD